MVEKPEFVKNHDASLMPMEKTLILWNERYTTAQVKKKHCCAMQAHFYKPD
jgi:hypothetical protein